MPTGATQQDEIITGPKPGEESLAGDLDNRREVTGDMLLGGHPNQEIEEEKPPGEGEEGKPPEKAEGEEGKPPEKKEEPTFRFKTQEEAEKAHGEAERLMTTKAQEAADLRRELDELKAKPPEKKEEPVKLPTDEEINAKIEAVAEAANDQALIEIGKLEKPGQYASDEEHDNYRKAAAKAWAKANAKIIAAATAARVSLSQADIDKIVDQRMEVRDATTKAARAEEDRKTAGERAWGDAVTFGKKAGLNLDDQESADYDLFDMAGQKLPETLRGKGVTPEVGEWMVNYVRVRTGKLALSEAEKEALARKNQEENQPLGKGGRKPEPKPPIQEKEGTLADDFREAKQARIL